MFFGFLRDARKIVVQPYKIEFQFFKIQIGTKIQKSILPKFEISIFSKWDFGRIRNRHPKTMILISIFGFWFLKFIFKIPQSISDFFSNLISRSKNSHSAPQITPQYFLNSFQNLKIHIFLRPKSWFCIRLDYSKTLCCPAKKLLNFKKNWKYFMTKSFTNSKLPIFSFSHFTKPKT